MLRREFVASALAVGAMTGVARALGQKETPDPPWIEQILVESEIGGSFDRLSDWAKSVLVPVAARHKVGPLGCFTLELGVSTPQLMVLIEHPSLAAMEERWKAMVADSEWVAGAAALESGERAGYARIDVRLLRATGYSPLLSEAVGKSRVPRFFELRVYHSPTGRQLKALHERFAGPEIKIFHRLGIRPILYADTVYGPDRPNLTYLTPFESLDAREKAWKAFVDDPEWKQVRGDSIARAGEIVNYTHRVIYRSAPYSPIL